MKENYLDSISHREFNATSKNVITWANGRTGYIHNADGDPCRFYYTDGDSEPSENNNELICNGFIGYYLCDVGKDDFSTLCHNYFEIKFRVLQEIYSKTFLSDKQILAKFADEEQQCFKFNVEHLFKYISASEQAELFYLTGLFMAKSNLVTDNKTAERIKAYKKLKQDTIYKKYLKRAEENVGKKGKPFITAPAEDNAPQWNGSIQQLQYFAKKIADIGNVKNNYKYDDFNFIFNCKSVGKVKNIERDVFLDAFVFSE